MSSSSYWSPGSLLSSRFCCCPLECHFILVAPKLPRNEFPPFEACTLSIVRMRLLGPATDVRASGEHTGCPGPSVKGLTSSGLMGILGVALVYVFSCSQPGVMESRFACRLTDTRPDSETPCTLPDPFSASSALACMGCCPF